MKINLNSPDGNVFQLAGIIINLMEKAGLDSTEFNHNVFEHEDYYADNQEIKDVGVYESDDNGETPEVDEADPGENLAEESLLIDLLDI